MRKSWLGLFLTIPILAVAAVPANAHLCRPRAEEQVVVSQSDIEALPIQIDVETASATAEISVNGAGTITVDDGGMTLTVNQDGSWQIAETVEPGQLAPSWDAQLCTGTFATMYVNDENELQWGGQQVCSDSETCPHRINVELRQGGTGFLDPQILKHAVTVVGVTHGLPTIMSIVRA